jgi:hypothetical protein
MRRLPQGIILFIAALALIVFFLLNFGLFQPFAEPTAEPTPQVDD